MNIEIGSVWTGTDVVFIVTDVKVYGEGTWVYYKNSVTGQEYNCLVEAFTHRFRQHVN